MGKPAELDNTWFEIEQSLKDIDTPLATHDHLGNAVLIERGVDDSHGRYYKYSTYISPSLHEEEYIYVGTQIYYEDGTTYVDSTPSKHLLN